MRWHIVWRRKDRESKDKSLFFFFSLITASSFLVHLNSLLQDAVSRSLQHLDLSEIKLHKTGRREEDHETMGNDLSADAFHI